MSLDSLQLCLLQLFWVSLIPIGLAGLVVWRKFSAENPFLQFFSTSNLCLQTLFSIMAGLLVLGVYIIPGYIFQWSIVGLQITYYASLVAASLLLIYYRSLWLSWLSPHFKHGLSKTLTVILACYGLVYDYYYCLRVKGDPTGDQTVQVAHINQMAHGHLSFSSPFFGHHGVVDPRYSTNILNALQSTAANLFHTTALTIWGDSYAFYRLLIWLSFLAFGLEVVPKKVRKLWIFIAVLTPFVYSHFFVNAELPDRIVLAWAAMLLCGLLIWLRNGTKTIALAAAILIATSHSLFSAVSFSFVVVLLISLLVSRSINFQKARFLVLLLPILIAPVVYNLHYPNLIASNKLAFFALPISGRNPELHHYGPLLLTKLNLSFPLLTIFGFGIGYLLIRSLKSHTKQYSAGRKTLAVVAGAVAIACYDITYSSFLAYFYLIIHHKQKAARWLIITACGFYGLLIYNPIFLKFFITKLPPWAVARFGEFNSFEYLAPIIGFGLILHYILRFFGYLRYETTVYLIVPLLLLASSPLFYPQFLDLQELAPTEQANMQNVVPVHSLQQLQPALKNQTVFAEDPVVSANVTEITTASVITILVYNTSPMVDNNRHVACGLQLQHHLDLPDLEAAHVTRVLTYDFEDKPVKALAETKPYLQQVAANADYTVFAVKPQAATTPSKQLICAIPYGQ